MRACTTDEIAYMLKMLDNHNEFDIIKAALSTHEIVTKIDEAMAYVCDRFISELLDDYLNDDTVVGTAFILGIMQGKRLERTKNSGKRTTASRRI